MDKYNMKDLLYRGQFSEVHLAKRIQDDRKVVIKRLFCERMNEQEKQQVIKEGLFYKKVDSKYLCKLEEVVPEHNQVNFVMEYCRNGDLNARIQKQIENNLKFTEKRVWQFFIEMCLGIRYLHKCKILHRDIKSQNIFLGEKYCVKIGDLGVARELSNTMSMASSNVGTPSNLSPELCLGEEYSYENDIWGLGVVLYQMLTLELPFQANNPIALSLKIMHTEPAPISEQYSEGLRHVCKNLLLKKPELRPKIDDIFNDDVVKQWMTTLGYSLAEQNLQLRHRLGADLGIMQVYQGPINFEYIFSDKFLYYRLLGVRPDANNDEIKQAYKRKMLIHHPDHGGTEEAFQKINNARLVLQDPELRTIYDNEGEIGLFKHRIKLEEKRRNMWKNLSGSQKGLRIFKWCAIGVTVVAVGCAVGAYALGAAGVTTTSNGAAGTIYTLSDIVATKFGVDSAFFASRAAALVAGAAATTTHVLENMMAANTAHVTNK